MLHYSRNFRKYRAERLLRQRELEGQRSAWFLAQRLALEGSSPQTNLAQLMHKVFEAVYDPPPSRSFSRLACWPSQIGS